MHCAFIAVMQCSLHSSIIRRLLAGGLLCRCLFVWEDSVVQHMLLSSPEMEKRKVLYTVNRNHVCYRPEPTHLRLCWKSDSTHSNISIPGLSRGISVSLFYCPCKWRCSILQKASASEILSSFVDGFQSVRGVAVSRCAGIKHLQITTLLPIMVNVDHVSFRIVFRTEVVQFFPPCLLLWSIPGAPIFLSVRWREGRCEVYLEAMRRVKYIFKWK